MAMLDKIFKNKGKAEKLEVEERTSKTAIETKNEEKKSYDFSLGVLLAPRVTEKASAGAETGKYTFIVARDKNKIEVKKSIEKTYGVKVVSVQILNMPSKKKRLGRILGRIPGFKKAIVTLEKGQSIEIQ